MLNALNVSPVCEGISCRDSRALQRLVAHATMDRWIRSQRSPVNCKTSEATRLWARRLMFCKKNLTVR